MAAVERDTAADLCVVVTRVSDRYSLYPVASAAIAAILLGALISLIRPDFSSRTVIAIELWLLITITLLLEWLPARLSIVPKRVKHAHAWQLAHREFNAHAIANPKQQHRILLFVSLGERYVEILADREIHAKVGEGEWDRIVADLVATMKDRRTADGLVRAIAACGALLETHYPRTGGPAG